MASNYSQANLEIIWDLDTDSKIDFAIDKNWDVKVVPLNVAIESWSGILHREGMTSASLEDMEQAIIEGASNR